MRIHLDIINSTNDYIKEQIKTINIDSLVVTANSQTKGRGQDNRKFVSDIGGLYMSIVFPFKPFCDSFVSLGINVAQAVKQVLEDSFNIKTTVKPPNDVYLNGKKLAGILPESVIDINNNRRLVVGIGINVNTKSFPDDLDIATSLYLSYNKTYDIDNMVLLLQNKLMTMYNNGTLTS